MDRLSQRILSCESVHDMLPLFQAGHIVDTNDMKQFLLSQIDKHRRRHSIINPTDNDQKDEEITQQNYTISVPQLQNRNTTNINLNSEFENVCPNNTENKTENNNEIEIENENETAELSVQNTQNNPPQTKVTFLTLNSEILSIIIEFVMVSNYKIFVLLNKKCSKALNSHQTIFKYYQLHFGNKFEEICKGNHEFVICPNHKQRILFIKPSNNNNKSANYKLSNPYWFRCGKWIISHSNNKREIKKDSKIQNTHFVSNNFVISCAIFNGHLCGAIHENIINNLVHLRLANMSGTIHLKELLLNKYDLSNLLCLEITEIEIIIAQNINEIGNILNLLLRKCPNLLFFKFSASKQSEIEIENHSKIETVKIPKSLQWLSLVRSYGYFNLDLSLNAHIIGLHIKDVNICEILWPKKGIIQCLAFESFTNNQSKFISEWNEYISDFKHKLNIRFIKALKYRNELHIPNQSLSRAKNTFLLQMNASNVRNINETLINMNNSQNGFDIWTLESFAKVQNDFNDYGAVQNPYLCVPIYFKEDIALDKQRLFEILLKISHLNYHKNYKICETLLRLKTIKWVGTFGRASS